MSDPKEKSTSKRKPLSTQPYRGTKDQFPEDQRLINYVFDVWRLTCERFGYEEYAGPFLEPIDLYLSKTSEEIVNEQLYHVHDKGDRHLAIRPEMTPTLARMVASRARQLPQPIRWYSIATCMRFERPQRSRLRQFDQFNLDVLGDNPHDEDVEVLLTILYSMKLLGASPEDFVIKISHRRLVNDFLATIAIPLDSRAPFLRLMDAVDKMSAEAFAEGAAKLGATPDQIAKARDFMAGDLQKIATMMGAENEHLIYLESLIKELQTADADFRNVFRFSPEVMRGFDYYTGIVFEVFDNDKENHRALFGGGRYDDLVGSFGGDKLSGVGYGVSEISLINFMTTHNLVPELKRPVDVVAFSLDQSAKAQVTKLAMILRDEGLNVEQSMGQRKIGKLFAHGSKVGAMACVFVGETERESGMVGVKWLATGEQVAIQEAEVSQYLLDKFQS